MQEISLSTERRTQLVDITRQVEDALDGADGASAALVYVPHTTAGVTINGLAIVNDRPNLGYSAHTQPPGGLPLYYRQNVIGGPNAFLIVVQDFNSFADAMANKLAKEIDVAKGPAERRVSLLR